jgi:serralysin
MDTASYADSGAAVTVSLAIGGAQNTGGGGFDTLIGIERLVGSAFADTLTGNNGANRLDGGAGADTMNGGGGDDIYIVNTAGDLVTEAAGGGTDRVNSSISYTLGNNVERLVLTGSANINAVGNSLNNVLVGNDSANILVGGLGNDRLTGGEGADTYRFNTALNASTNVDDITDFSVADDTIQLDNDVFTAAGAVGTLAAGAFRTGTSAADASDRIIYDPVTGRVWYDADGNGAGAAVLFAELDPGLALTNADFQIIG